MGILAFILLILVAARWAPHFLATPAQALARPLLAASHAVGEGLGGGLTFFESKSGLERQNAELEQEIVFYTAAVAERDYFISQNAQLGALLGQIGSSSPQKFVAAKILSKPDFSPYDTMLVAAGSGSGIAAGDLVFADANTLIGYVSSVSVAAATITCYSTPGQSVNVLIGSSSIEAAAQGLGGGTLEVQLPRNSPVALGDIVTAADASGADILGRVEVATATPTDPFERILFASPLDIFDLSYVLIQMPVQANQSAHGPAKK